MKMTPTTLDRKMNKLRLFAFALAVWLLIAAMPISAFAELLELETQPMQAPTVYVLAEDTTKRSAFEKHYYCSDGTFVAVTYPEAVHYKDESGEWLNVDMRLASDLQADSYESQSGDFKTVFSTPGTSGDVSVMANGTAAAAPTISMQSGEYTLSWGLSGTKSTVSSRTSTYALNPNVGSETMTLFTSADAQIEILGELKTSEPALSVQKVPVTDPDAFALSATTNQVIYEDVFGADQNVSVRYTVSLNKIEEDILITAPTEMTSFSMQIECGELTPTLNPDNSIDFLDNYSNMVYHISTPYLADAAFAISYDVDVTLTEQNGVCTVTYTPDAEWMNAPEREYPIMLDPAVTTNDYTSAIMDTYVVENDASGYYTSQYLYFNPNGSTDRIAVIRIQNLPSIDVAMPIVSAKLCLAATSTQNPNNQVTLSTVQEGFNVLTGNYSALMSHMIDSQTIASESLKMITEFDVTKYISDIYTGNIGKTFAVHCDAGNTSSYVFPLHSMESTNTGMRPCLTITYGYNLPQGLSVGDEITIQNVGSSGYLYPYSGLIGNGNSVLHAPGSTSSDTYRLLTLRQNSANGTYRLEYTPWSNSTGAYISAATTTNHVVMYNTTNIPSNIKQDWLIVPDSINTFKIVLASDMRYVLTADNATSGYMTVAQCTGAPTTRQKWKIYKNGDPIENVIENSTPLDSDYYYINSPSTGKFLNVSSNTVGADFGRVNFLGDEIKWKFTQLPDGYYTIQNEAAPGKLLAGGGLTGLAMTSSDGTISENQKWIVSLGITSYTVTNAGTGFNLIEPGYVNSLWRIVKCSNYVELGSFGFSNLTLTIGEAGRSQMVSLTPYPGSPGGAINYISLTNDFIYEVADKSIAIVNTSTGIVTGIGKGETKVTVTHKVTGIQKEFTVTVLKKAIFILPGIMGSQIYANQDIEIPPIFPDLITNTFEKDTRLWDPSVSNVLLISEKIRALECSSLGIPVYSTCAPGPTVNYSGQNSEKQLGAQNTYQVLYQYVYEQCYDLGYDIVLYEYDWRYDPYLTAIELSQYIQSNYYGDICFISHSMGGIVSSYYISLGESQRSLVDKHISIGTPYLGAAKMVDVLLNGNALDGIIKQMATSISIHSVVGNIPSIYGLMPYEEYFYPCVEYVNGLTKYECSTYNETITYMSNNISNWNSTLYSTTVANHDRLFINQEHITTLVDSYYIVGNNLDTISSITLNWNEYFPESRTKTMSGDGTVTKQSATINQSLPSSRVLYAESDESIGLNATHIGLVESECIIDLICNIITENVTLDTDESILNDEYGVYTNR